MTRLAGIGLALLALMGCQKAADDVDEAPAGHIDAGDFVVDWQPAGDYSDYRSWLNDLDFMQPLADGLNATLKLPQDIWLSHGQCGMENAFFIPDQSQVFMCYELVNAIYGEFYTLGTLTDDQVSIATFNTWVFILYHEIGHSLVHVLDMPITGLQEDAVDQFSSIILIEGGASYMVVDAAYFWLISDSGSSAEALADEHGLNMQRFYNMLCYVYGSDPSNSDWIVDLFPEMESRVGKCENEYVQARDAWETLLAPHEF
jgi:hypothetical protein